MIACAEEEHVPVGTQLLVNPNMSMFPDSVDPWRSNRSGGIGVSKEIFFTGNRSLFIENHPDSVYLVSGSWSQSYHGPMPGPGSRLVLTAFLKGEGIRNLREHEPTFFINLSAYKIVNGPNEGKSVNAENLYFPADFDWIPIKLTLETIPPDAKHITVSFMMPYRTLGKLYLDEISVTVE
ncbi:MAG TPA: hypothetical protein VK921_18480 [Anditalea sp.]|nr:hypothetical protein [Anditalea sp.]